MDNVSICAEHCNKYQLNIESVYRTKLDAIFGVPRSARLTFTQLLIYATSTFHKKNQHPCKKKYVIFTYFYVPYGCCCWDVRKYYVVNVFFARFCWLLLVICLKNIKYLKINILLLQCFIELFLYYFFIFIQ